MITGVWTPANGMAYAPGWVAGRGNGGALGGTTAAAGGGATPYSNTLPSLAELRL